MRVLVCGGRAYNKSKVVHGKLDEIHAGPLGPIDTIIHGGASGADNHASVWAIVNKIAESVFVPDWERQGRAAGPIRNQRMIDKGAPDLVLAFPGGRGTSDMIRRAKAAGLEVIEL